MQDRQEQQQENQEVRDQARTADIEGTDDGLEVRPDPDLQDLIPSFMEDRRRELADIERAVDRGDFESLRRLAHTWKGICRPYGFIRLELLSRNLEAAGQRENKQEAAEMARLIRSHLDNVRIIYDH